MAAVGNTPPQYVFELTAVQAVRKFLAIDAEAEDIAAIYANALEPLYNTAAVRPPNGDLTSPARVSYPRAFSYVTPRSFRLSITTTF